MRNDYRLCKVRTIVRAILNYCVTSKKSQSRTLLGPEPSDLPKLRLDFDYTFCNAKLDFAGPFYVKNIYGKNDQMFKSYICLFSCATTKNVHLELTPSMEACDIIKALLRSFQEEDASMFISDYFSSFRSKEVSKFLLVHNVDRKFILHYLHGGEAFYDRLARTVKATL